MLVAMNILDEALAMKLISLSECIRTRQLCHAMPCHAMPCRSCSCSKKKTTALAKECWSVYKPLHECLHTCIRKCAFDSLDAFTRRFVQTQQQTKRTAGHGRPWQEGSPFGSGRAVGVVVVVVVVVVIAETTYVHIV